MVTLSNGWNVFVCQVTAVLGLSLTAISVTLAIWQHHQVTWQIMTVSTLIPAITMTLSYLLAWLLLKRNTKVAKAISFETAIQNTPTAFAFLMISYRGRVLGEMVAPLMFSGLFGLFEEIIIVTVYRLVKLASFKKKKPHESREPVEEVERLEL